MKLLIELNFVGVEIGIKGGFWEEYKKIKGIQKL